MKIVKADDSTKTWVLGGGDDVEPCLVCHGSGSEECPGCWGSGRRGDLPVRTDIDEAMGVEVQVSTWQPEDGDRRALLNGASIELMVWGGQPPVALVVGEPTVIVEATYTAAHLHAAMDALWHRAEALRGADLWPRPGDDDYEQMVDDAIRTSAPPGTTSMGGADL